MVVVMMLGVEVPIIWSTLSKLFLVLVALG
jgi:hypothetical protein